MQNINATTNPYTGTIKKYKEVFLGVKFSLYKKWLRKNKNIPHINTPKIAPETTVAIMYFEVIFFIKI